MLISEIVKKPNKPRKPEPPKTDWEKNTAKLRSKERRLNAKTPVAPIKHTV